MTHYTFTNEKDSEEITRELPNDEEARHFVINHLDLSKNWHIIKIKE